jgi:DNA polymerase-3 subunit epsilon
MNTTTTTTREQAAQWARELLARADLIVLDTETTGLGPSDQIVQLAIVDRTGAVLLDTLVKPTCPIGRDAYFIHRITEAMLADAPPFAALVETQHLASLLTGRRLAIYNADFDIRLLRQSASAAGVTLPPLSADCVMRAYSRWVGQWNPRRHDYRWQALPGGDHSALGDARACLTVLRRMAGLAE